MLLDGVFVHSFAVVSDVPTAPLIGAICGKYGPHRNEMKGSGQPQYGAPVRSLRPN